MGKGSNGQIRIIIVVDIASCESGSKPTTDTMEVAQDLHEKQTVTRAIIAAWRPVEDWELA